ncbi:MAG: MarR family winged helix-turn-helix transcriptional regulator [Paenibacillaceae bacterium]
MFTIDTESYGKYVSAIYRHLQILLSAELAPYRIGSGQYLILMAIAHKERITQKALSEELLLDKTTITKAIAKLEAEGYVRREPDQADNRYNLLYLTEAGRDVVPKVKEALNRVSDQSLVGINDDEYALMLSSLKKVIGNMSELVRNG